MRNIIIFETKDLLMPIEYRKGIMSFFKGLLKEVNNGEYSEKYYKDTITKPYSFATKLYEPKFSKDTVEIGKKEFELIFSTVDPLTGLIFSNGFLRKKGKWFKFGETEIKVKKIISLHTKKIDSDEINIKMLSPLCVREHSKVGNKDYYYSTNNEKFRVKAEEVIKKQLIDAGYSEKKSTVEIYPINSKKTVVTHYGQKVEVSLGMFKLIGNPEALKELYLAGIGSRSGAGFGLFEII